MELLMKAAVIGVSGALIALLIKKSSPEFSLVLALAVTAMILGLAYGLISGVSEIIDLAADYTGLSSAVISPVLKCIGIGIITRLACDVCKDAGSASIASSVELVGAAAALYVALPLMKTLMQMIGELI